MPRPTSLTASCTFVCTVALALAGCAVGGAISRGPSRNPAPISKRNSARDSAPPTKEPVGSGDPEQDFAALEEDFGQSPPREKSEGLATYYADSLAGHRMANGQRYDPRLATMAHRTLPMGTVVRVVRVSNGASVVVRVTDRGPFGHSRRIADLSRAAAKRLGMLRDGVVEVRLEILGR